MQTSSLLGCCCCTLLLFGACSDRATPDDTGVIDSGIDISTPDQRVDAPPLDLKPQPDLKLKLDVNPQLDVKPQLDSMIKADVTPWPDIWVPDGGPTCNAPGSAGPTTTATKGKVDILVVMDNSAAMSSLQTQFNSALGGLETALGSGLDYRLGIVTTSIGAGPYNLPSCVGCNENALLRLNASCTKTGAAWLHNNKGTKNYTGTLSQAVSCMFPQNTNGCGFEQPLQAATIALTNASINTGFLRPDAALLIVIYSNEDDCSAKNVALYDPSPGAVKVLGQLLSFRCFQHGISCDINDPTILGARKNCKPMVGGYLYDVSHYASAFKALKPANRVAVAVIAGPTSPVSVGLDNTNTTLKPSCATSQGNAAPAIRLQALTAAFGAKGAFHSICGALAPVMTSIGNLAKGL